jgi:hypothetical protein
MRRGGVEFLLGDWTDMRIAIGPLPPASEFDDAASGWKALREPPPLAAIALSLPIGVALAYGLGAAWKTFTPFNPGFSITFSSKLSVITIAFAGVLNALFSCVDVLGVGLLLPQVPMRASVRNSGWKTWYRYPETSWGVAEQRDEREPE